MKVENVKISNVFLGLEDHNILTLIIQVEGDSWSVGFGGYNMIHDDFLSKTLTRLFDVLQVRNLDQLKGKVVRVRFNESKGTYDEIGHAIKDKWFNIRELAKGY